MKNRNKKGFTLVELVIVIAVIAILAGVMIGTFAGVISRANQSKALQEVKAQVDAAYVEYVADNKVVPVAVKVENGVVTFKDTIDVSGEYNLVDGKFVPVVSKTDVYVYLKWTNGGYEVVSSKTALTTNVQSVNPTT